MIKLVSQSTLIFLIALQITIVKSYAQREGKILRVAVENATIKRTEDGISNTMATVRRGTRLWAFRFTEDQGFGRVIDPVTGEEGWIWLRHAPVTELPVQQKRDWEAAVRMFREYAQTFAFIDPSQAEQSVLQAMDAVEVALRRLNSGADYVKTTQALTQSRRLQTAVLCLDRAKRKAGTTYQNVFEALIAGKVASNLEAHQEAEQVYKVMAATFAGEQRRWANLLLAAALSDQDKFDEAHASFKRERRSLPSPDFGAVLDVGAGEAFIAERKFQKAEQVLRPAHMASQASKDTLALVRMVLAESCKKQGRDAEAETLLKQARAASDEPLIAHALGHFYTEQNRKLEEAEQLTREALNAAPENPEFLSTLGWALFRQGKLHAAKDTLLQSIHFSTKPYAEPYEHLGDCLQALGLPFEADRRWTTGLEIAGAESVPDPDLIARLKRKTARSSVTSGQPNQVADHQKTSKRAEPVEQVDFSQYRLSAILEAAKQIDAASEAHLVKVVVGNASVRMDNKVMSRRPYGQKLYAVQIDEPNNRALVKIPGEDMRGWMSLTSIEPHQYSNSQIETAQSADKQMQKSYELYNLGKLEEAASTARLAYERIRDSLGEDDLATANVRAGYGDMLTKCHGAEKSLPELLAAVDAFKSRLGENHLVTANALANLASAYSFSDDKFAKAIPPIATALKVTLSLGDSATREQIHALSFMGNAAFAIGNVSIAREFLELALKKSESVFGTDHETTLDALTALARLENAPEAVEAARRKVHEISQRILPENHRDRIEAQLTYGQALADVGRLMEGRKLMEDAVTALRANYDDHDSTVLEADQILAGFYFDIGETEDGLSAMKSVVDRISKVYGPTHSISLQTKGDLASMLLVDGQYEAALGELSGLLRSASGKSEDFGTAYIIQHSVGLALMSLGRLEEAEEAFEQAHNLGKSELAVNDPNWSSHWHAVTRLAIMKGDFTEAEKRLDRVREFTQQLTAGVQDTSVAEMAGEISAAERNYEDAAEKFDDVTKEVFRTISDDLPALSEKEQLSYLKNFVDAKSTVLSLSLETPSHSVISTKTAEWHVNLKANSHELLTHQMRALRNSEEHAEQLRELFTLRQKLARESVRDVPAYGRQSHEARIRRLTEDEASLSRQLASVIQVAGVKRDWTDLSELRRFVPPNARLVTFARIRPANYRYTRYSNRYSDPRYVAWVIPPSGSGDVVSVDLGLAAEIDAAIQKAHTAIHDVDALKRISSEGEANATSGSRQILRDLSVQILEPVLAVAGSTSELILSPDAQLWTVPWAALPVSKDKLLIEDFRVRMVVTGRDLLPKKTSTDRSPEPNRPVIFADPAFDDRGSQKKIAINDGAGRRLRSSGLRFSGSFNDTQPLPGTAAEAAAIRDSLKTFAGSTPQIFLQKSATESAAKSLRNPKSVVMSTHGFFFEEPEDRSPNRRLSEQTRIYRNPLLRCGLLLSGCNHAASASDDTDDGILTGLEIVNMDLRGTELVVLSACETGLGDVRNGEGIAGLRQSFQLAGAESVVASLWQVDDRSTALLMNDFFRHLAEGKTKSEALRQAQLARIRARRDRHGAAHPFFWAAFTVTGADSVGGIISEESPTITAADSSDAAREKLPQKLPPEPSPPSDTPAPKMQAQADAAATISKAVSGTVTVQNASNLFTVRVRLETDDASNKWFNVLPGRHVEFAVDKTPATLSYYGEGHSIQIERADTIVEMNRIDLEWKASVTFQPKPSDMVSVAEQSSTVAETGDSNDRPFVEESDRSVLVRNESQHPAKLRLVKGFKFIKEFIVAGETEKTISVPEAHVLKIFDAARGGWVRSRSAKEIIVAAAGTLTKTKLPAEQVAALGLERTVIVRNKSNVSVELSLLKGVKAIKTITVDAAELKTIEIPSDHTLRLYQPTTNEWAEIEPGVGVVLDAGWETGQQIRFNEN